jgi:hypothetical protein
MTTSRTAVLTLGLALCASIVLAAWWYSSGKTFSSVGTTPLSGMTCDMGISAARAVRDAAPITLQPVGANTQTAKPG